MSPIVNIVNAHEQYVEGQDLIGEARLSTESQTDLKIPPLAGQPNRMTLLPGP